MILSRRQLFGVAASTAAISPFSGVLAQAAKPLTVFAAASLTNAMELAGRAFTARSGLPVRFSFASSAVLARQLEAGAPADMFVSADLEWMDYVAARGLIQRRTRVNLLRGRLALIAPKARRLQLRLRRDAPLARALGARGRLATGDPEAVPAGRYAQAALAELRLWEQVRGRLARTENVRVALALVARGEAPLGIVYETDARQDPRVRIVDMFPAGSHPPIVYPAAITSKAQPGASAFHAFLRGREAQAIFRRLGFFGA